MQPATITTFQYMSSADPVEAVTHAATQAFSTHEKWFVFLQNGEFVCSDEAHVHPFVGVPCVAELHGQNLSGK